MALVWLQFGYSSGVWTKHCWLSMPLVVRGWAASLRATPHFGTEITKRSIKKAAASVFKLPLGDGAWGLRLVTASQVTDSVTNPSHLQMIDSSAGRSSARGGRGGAWLTGRGHREQEHILAPEKTNSNTFLELHVFLKQERGYIFLVFVLFIFFFSEVLVLSEKKVLLRYQYIM